MTDIDRKLAWSNTGSIAQIRDDGRKIVFRTLQQDQKTRTWDLSDESKHPIVAPVGRCFIHVQWNGLGIDLAAADNLGGVHVYSMAGAVGRMQPAHGEIFHSDDHTSDFYAAVGLHWLPLYPAEFRVSEAAIY